MTAIINSFTTSQIISSAHKVHRTLGTGLLESVYRNALCMELNSRNFRSVIEQKLEVFYEGKRAGLFYADILVQNKLIIETKCVSHIFNRHIAQLKNYLNIAGEEFGYIFNFKNKRLEYMKIFR